MMLAVNVDQQQIVSVRLSLAESLFVCLRRVYVVTGYTEDLVAYRPKYLASTDMQNVCLRLSAIAICGFKHWPIYLLEFAGTPMDCLMGDVKVSPSGDVSILPQSAARPHRSHRYCAGS
jgi:hypothetical protein